MFDQMKKLYDLQKKTREIKKALENTIIETSQADGKVKMVFSADQKVKSLSIDPSLLSAENKANLEKYILRCIEEGIEKSQQAAVSKMKDIPGLPF